MRFSRPASLFAAAALLASAALAAQTTVNLRDADLRALIDDVSKVTGTSFVVDPRVQGKVSVVSDKPLGRAAYFELFLATLRANGFVAVPMGNGGYRIQPAEAGASAAASPQGNRFTTSVVPLKAIDAQQALESLRPVLSRQGAASANRAGNSVIITDFADNIARARAVLTEIDRDRSSNEVVALKNAGPRDLAQSLNALIGQRENSGRLAVTVVPIDASNAIAIRGDTAQVAKIAAMARDLDQRAATGSEVRVLFLQQADAAAVLPVLQQLIGQAPASTGASRAASGLAGTPFGNSGNRQQGGGLGGGQGGGNNAGMSMDSSAPASASLTASSVGVAVGDVNRQAIIARYEDANAIIISAPAEIQRKLGEVVRQLDTRRPQVHVEAVIVEISESAARKLGVQFALTGKDGAVPFFGTNYSNATPSLLALAGAVAAQKGIITGDAAEQAKTNALNSLLGSSGMLGGGFGTIGSNFIFGTIINAVRSDGDSNILSTPSVMTLDNQPARILVGQEIPVTTGEALGNNLDNSFRTVQRQDVGIQLSVKPQINAGGTITLTLKQIVSSIASTVADRDFVLNKREIETSVTVGDGQIVALGGLLDQTNENSIERVPLLSDIPGLGELFKSRARSRKKTNLMVFIRPTVVRSQADSDAITANRWDQIREAQTASDGYSSLDALAYDYLRTLPPYKPAPFPPPAPESQR